MRKLAFGYSTRCNIRCAHCVAAGETPAAGKMDHPRARTLIAEMAQAGVGGMFGGRWGTGWGIRVGGVEAWGGRWGYRREVC